MQVTLVIPLRIDPDRPVSDLDRFVALGLPSLDRCMAEGFVRELLVISPEEDVAACQRALAGASRFPIRVIEEARIQPGIAQDRGWHKQQILKLAVASQVATTWYITLDADVLCTRRVDEAFLFPDGKAIWQRERADLHWKWWTTSQQVLGCGLDLEDGTPMFGVTPALLHGPSVMALTAFLSGKHPEGDWARMLLDRKKEVWTEYSLYWTYLLMQGLTGQYYSTSPNTPYARHSVWSKDELSTLSQAVLDDLFAGNASHAFMVFQSNMEQSLASTVKLLCPYLGNRPGPTLCEAWTWHRHAWRYRLRKLLRPLRNRLTVQ